MKTWLAFPYSIYNKFMAFIKILNEDFKIRDNKIVLSKSYLERMKPRFKKITGSRIASVLGLSDYVSPAKMWAIMVGLYEDVVDPFFVKPGIVIEPLIKEHVEKTLNISYLSYEPSKIGWDVFKENSIFGGIPDGEPNDAAKNSFVYMNNQRMLEIKTTSRDKFKFSKEGNSFKVKIDTKGLPEIKTFELGYLKWFGDDNVLTVPLEYKFQLGLYLYLRNWTKGVFAVGFLHQEDYVHPEKFNLSDRKFELINFDIDLNEFKKVIDEATEWYQNFIVKGVSPKLSSTDYATWIVECGYTFA